MSGVHGPRYFTVDVVRLLTQDDVKYIYGLSLKQFLPKTELLLGENTALEIVTSTPDDPEIRNSVEVDFKCPDKTH